MSRTRCRYCPAKLYWISTTTGRTMPCERRPVRVSKLAPGDKYVTQGGSIKTRGPETGPLLEMAVFIPHQPRCPGPACKAQEAA